MYEVWDQLVKDWLDDELIKEKEMDLIESEQHW